ncbi:MAG: helicase-exonuclease AddAB subunit AddA [Ruminococcaceae bacterium]|nr:helicase-exonuclease AddAB subunit AddA [Oscillospiraceae bacterium]
MADMLTNEQRAAVEDRGRGLLVSAAAGSGKTRVLVERLFSYVQNEGANLDDFLIITYTRAAAAELRGKIAAALSARLEKDPGNEHLRRQLLRVYRADIKTVDAFCTALLRENCHLLGEDEAGRALRPDFRVLDEQEAAAMRERVLTRTLEQFYEGLSDGDGGTCLADTLGAGRDDRALAELVSELYEKVQAQSYPERWLREQEARWAELPERIEDTEYGVRLLHALRAKALHWASVLENGAREAEEDEKLAKSYAVSFHAAASQLSALADAAGQGWDAARAALLPFPRLVSARGVENGALKERLKCLWDKDRASMGEFAGWFTASSEETAGDLRTVADAMIALLRLTEDFLRGYAAEKRRRNAADFSDQEHEAIRLLLGADGTPTELARTVGDRYREIMVDEYQDTNEVQNCIFEAISKDGTNLFTVGDVKQSIYRFRLADPTIFLDHYERYPHAAEAAPGERAKLILSRNFRSRPEILDAANFVFSNILSKEMGELDYGADEALYPGAEQPTSEQYRTEFHLLDPSGGDDGEGLRAPEAEAAFVAGYIRRMLDEGFPVTDDQTHEKRGVREEDIVILMRSPGSRLTAYRQALESRGIAVSADAGEDFFSSVEVSVVFALLQVLDNPRQDVPLIAVLRSPLFGFTADRLALLRGAMRDGDFYDALLAGEGEDVASFLSTLRSLREAAQGMSVRRLLARIYDECNVLGIFGAMPGGRERKENLIAFASLAEQFETAGFRGLFAFVSHLRELSGGFSSAGAQTAAGVRIMSIHKSKGLEFPVVILADLARKFNNMDFTGSVLVHPKLGLGPERVDMERRIHYPTAARLAVRQALRREMKAEELRLLYVAMTRAKEKLVMVHTRSGAARHIEELLASASCPVLPEAVDDGKCLGDWVMLPLLCRPEAEPLRALAGFDAARLVTPTDSPWLVEVHGLESAAESQAAPESDSEICRAEPGAAPDMDALSWTYPWPGSTELCAKLTATQLKGRAADAEIAEQAKLPPRLRSLARPRFVEEHTKLTGAERGTAIHLVMEHLRFDCEATADAVRAEIDALRDRRLLTPEQAEAADAEAIARFLRSSLAARIRAGTGVEREYRFSLLSPARAYDALAAPEDSVLLQGVVDCFFEEDGELVVLDFKTDRITQEELAERAAYYQPQLEAYASALSRITGKRVKERILYFFALDACARA